MHLKIFFVYLYSIQQAVLWQTATVDNQSIRNLSKNPSKNLSKYFYKIVKRQDACVARKLIGAVLRHKFGYPPIVLTLRVQFFESGRDWHGSTVQWWQFNSTKSVMAERARAWRLFSAGVMQLTQLLDTTSLSVDTPQGTLVNSKHVQPNCDLSRIEIRYRWLSSVDSTV